jgi:agmatinase
VKKLHYAQAVHESEAQIVLFSANSNYASHAPSHQTASKVDRSIFSAHFAIEAENQSPSLSEKMIPGHHVYDQGQLELPDDKLEQIKTMAKEFHDIFAKGKIPICLGGDHLVKYAGISSLFELKPNSFVIYLDAHPDCHMTEKLYYGSILHHIFNNKLASPKQVILTGLRQANAKEKLGYDFYAMPTIFGVDFSIHSIKDIVEKIKSYIPKGSEIYFSVDLDGFDPADTPGVEQPCPGGPKVNHFLALMHLLATDYTFVGMDVTEFLPIIDTQKLTALAMIRIVKEFCSLIPAH